MNLQKQFEEETNKESLTSNDYGGYYYSDEYVEWLEKAVKNKAVLPHVNGSLHIDFAVYLTGHDRETIEQMYNDWHQ